MLQFAFGNTFSSLFHHLIVAENLIDYSFKWLDYRTYCRVMSAIKKNASIYEWVQSFFFFTHLIFTTLV